MKKFCCYVIPCLLLICLLFSGCESTPEPNDTPVTQGTTSSIKTNDSVWYSEEAGVRGRIWLGMTEKEVYDALNKYNITISQPYDDIYEYDEYGAEYQPPESYYKKCFYTEGHEMFWFDKDDRLMEIWYQDQMHSSSAPVNKEFQAQRGVQRRGTYEEMVDAYGEPDQVVTIDILKSYVYHLESGDYLHFVYQDGDPIQSIHYSRYPYLFSQN